uniref:Ectonucleotide pyrophosphatase/phosphodiesterase 1 n=1 Tax=Salmo trutta TaxID=8032 RepID=A0A673W8Y2_SALTR
CGQRWTCSRFRCGEQSLADSLCSCSDDCVKAGDCCANYYSTCKGKVKSWIEEECEDIQTPQCPDSFSKPPLILVSMDGFRAGYLKAYGSLLPVINKLRNCGTTTPYMRPAYPTKTFPNHYTIVTGLYPESHGIVDNKMYDVTRNASFSLKVAEKFNAKWYQGEPVWLTAMYNKLKSATFFWPGADVAINGRFPDFYKMYDRNIPFEERISTIFQWLNLPQGERPDFYTLYLEEPDSAGHRYGPMSSQVIEALLNVDRLLGFLMDGLKQKNLHHCVNLVLLSDHGMEEASCKKAAFVNSYQDNVDGFTVVQGPAARIQPKRVPEDFYSCEFLLMITCHFQLSSCPYIAMPSSCRIPDQPMRPYLKEHLPKRMHFANNVRIERAHLYMKPGWQAALYYCSGGFHGSDNVFKNMQTIFIGYGPGLKYKTNVAPFENIEVYNLLCDLLDIPPAPNNGTHGSLNHLLKNPPHLPVYPDELSSDSTCEASGPAPSDNLGCSCSARTKAEVRPGSTVGAKALHLPYGIPQVLQENADYCVLHHANYVNGYSKDILMPLWVAYTINPLPLSPVAEACVRTDVRVAPLSSQNCVRYRDNPALTYGLLHPPNLGANGTEAESLLTSNMVPMYPAFKDVWMYFHDVLLVKYSQQLNGVNVVSGPIFDQHYDGHFDAPTAPFPTHFYVILTSCGNSSFSPADCQGRLETTSFILPHRPDHTEICANGSDLQWVQEWAQFHAARVRDVELLTGLSFYHDRISVEETLQLKTFLQTF